LLHGLARGRRALEKLRRLFLVWLLVADALESRITNNIVRTSVASGEYKRTLA